MRLTREQRNALFAGGTPKIVYPGARPCPVKVGDVAELSKNVRLEVTGVRRTAKGDHTLIYVLHNRNLGQRFLANQHGQLHPEQYVHNPAGAIDREAGECVDDFTQRRITRAAREREVLENAEFVAAAEAVLTELKRLGHPADRPLRRELDRYMARQRNRAA